MIVADRSPTLIGADIFSGLCDRSALIELRYRNLAELNFFQNLSVPCSSDVHSGISQGRSIYLSSPSGLVKVKGLYGFQPKLGVLSREPNCQFGSMLDLHLALDKNWRFSAVQSSPKAKYCLSLKGAVREFDALNRLSKVGASKSPICSFPILDLAGAPEVDLFGRTNGAVVSEFGKDHRFLSHLMSFSVVGIDILSDNVSVVSQGETSSILGAEVLEAMEHFSYFSELIGRLRRRAVEVGVLRHAAHLGNFVVDMIRGKLYMSDTDSCLLLGEDLEESALVVQIARDLSSDLARQISDLSYRAYSKDMISGMGVSDKHNPILSYLNGFFSDDLESRELRGLWRDMFKQYRTFLCHPNRFNTLRALAQRKSDFITCGFELGQHQVRAEWEALHLEFRPKIFSGVLQSLQKVRRFGSSISGEIDASSIVKQMASEIAKIRSLPSA